MLGSAGAAALAVLLAGLVGATSARVTRVSAANARFVGAPCPAGVPANVKHPRCGYLVVPENRARPGGRKIRLAVVRIPAVSRDSSGVPLVYLNGGPGSDALSVSGELVDSGFNRDREVIVLAQRGTYGSKPLLACRSLDDFRANLDRRLDARSTGRGLAAAAARCRAQLRARGVDLAAFNTTENAADVADLRRVLGIRSWDVFAHSYGTELGLTYMRLYPKGIR
ncbi:MAG TPA: alpha/beta hydrolase, partial [Solirubrobacteraceae bacterium]